MSKKINLYLETSKGMITIPFLGIKEADLFTIEYTNRLEFLDSLINILDLRIDRDDVGNIYFSYKDIENIYFDYETCLPVKYSRDNYNVDSLVDNFALYLRQDQRRLDMPGVRNVGKKIVYNFKPGYVSNNDIGLIANAYLRNDYRKMRDTYFMLIELNTLYEHDVFSIKIDNVPYRKNNVSRKELFQLESNSDDYVQYLIELSSRGEDEYDWAREELSKIDNDDIKRSLGKSSSLILDGFGDMSLISSEEVQNLEKVTGMNIEILRELCKMQISNGRGK